MSLPTAVLGSSQLEMLPEHNAEVPWNAPQCKQVVRGLTGKFCVLNKLFSCVSDSTIIGRESKVMNQQYIKYDETHRKHGYVLIG